MAVACPCRQRLLTDFAEGGVRPVRRHFSQKPFNSRLFHYGRTLLYIKEHSKDGKSGVVQLDIKGGPWEFGQFEVNSPKRYETVYRWQYRWHYLTTPQ
jgi:hypothetical protein